ncbi:ABC transporter substrate-binding protein [Rhodovulum sp. 12E13]|uniref:ABC transporter substrate-binding protein n=1 Tax=Rhodovulum sp. 12E13 TaxID=2203891 RepID=UPI000E12182F|nr:ABC transporter substrate-binding protein [Rhodovulum sp. 12E13]RDC67753.1 ABC transporter substrate-binding protein [Rhodovulum sp. 12E13]
MRLMTSALALTLAAGAADAQTRIEFWHAFSGNNGDAVGELAEMFNESQPDYEIVPVYTGNYTEGTQKLTAAIAGGTAPGLVMLEITRYGLFADRGALEPLQPYIDAASADWTEQIRPFALEASKCLGESYVIPFNVSTPVMYYNKDMFRAAGLDPEQPPRTWEAVTEAAEALTIRDGDETTQWGLTTPPQWVRWAMTNQAGGGWVDPADNAVQLDSPESVKAYQYAADWVNVHEVASLEAALDEDVADQYFDTGRAAIEFNSTGGLTGNLTDLPFDLGVAPLPCETVCAAPIGGATLGIVATAEDSVKDGAWEFIRFVTTPENNALVFVRTGYLPIIKGAIDTHLARERIEEHPEYLIANEQLEVAFARARPPAMPAIRSEEPAVWQSIVLQEQTAEEALGAFAQQMRDMIARDQM